MTSFPIPNLSEDLVDCLAALELLARFGGGGLQGFAIDPVLAQWRAQALLRAKQCAAPEDCCPGASLGWP